ncbi:pyrroline-5-carboxylate reductase [Pseudomonas syringae]|uniref:pyrroline-5-carboxylate reductase n=1 Tax=Pseudomonas syringae TaxID=317 RepID=UPI000FFE4ECC|nr:pyrroline-5-carboxylate reductase [Pseudomonas syringae]RXF63972.1 pyrroline-5-carboxylate reductase [Pseudomonas syringae]
MKVLFLGYGKMGSALGEAWLNTGLVKEVTAYDPGAPSGMQALIASDLSQLPSHGFDLVVAAVKPNMAARAISALPASALQGAILLSIMAGVTSATLKSASGGTIPVVRAMPNTPVMVNAGCTGLYTDSDIGQRRNDLTRLFEAVGIACWVADEEQLHAVTAISGSGPAYYHLFSESLADAGAAMGLPEELAKRLAGHTALGAAKLQCQPDASFETLRKAVTSPNGTTAAAIDIFEKQSSLRELVKTAAEAARQRSVELSQD